MSRLFLLLFFLHRSQTHRALDLHPAVSHFFRFWLWLTTGMKTKDWVSIHRKHHAKCETVDDPHSPQIKGIKKVLFEGAELYRIEAKNKETLLRYGQGTPDDWIERHLYSKYSVFGVSTLFILNVILFGIPGVTIWAIQMMWIPFFAAGIINGIGHYWGYRNFECPDASRNIIPLGWLIGGEEMHNNHHTFASSAKFSVKWWEFDLGWGYICMLQALGLARVKRVPPVLEQTPGKLQVDIETVKAIVTNRFHVMARYSREVLLPILRDEMRRTNATSKQVLKRAKVLLTQSEFLLDEDGKKKIADLISKHFSLGLVYHYRLKLQAIWGRTTTSQRELLEALQDWRQQAEATGVAALQSFSAKLVTFSTQKG